MTERSHGSFSERAKRARGTNLSENRTITWLEVTKKAQLPESHTPPLPKLILPKVVIDYAAKRILVQDVEYKMRINR